ncbi:MAG: alkaline phosphatase family protein [Bacteroidia bacterium]|nr:alkaline phosphatase family protein [Bacteroidia bacterium]
MKRRDFVKKVGAATAGALVAPYILPSGRLFAATGMRRANHVVFCLFAGGVRNLESVQKAEGNLMRSMINGIEPISADIAGSMISLPASPLPLPLQNYGTLFKNFQYASGPTGHYNGHTTAITGSYTSTDLSIKDNPFNPTVFEYYRKYNSPQQTALNAWWVSNSLGPYPALNYSKYPGYGAAYGANFIAPTSLISAAGYNAIGTPRTFTSQEEAVVNNMRGFMDNNFPLNFTDNSAGVTNNPADAMLLQTFISQLYTDAVAGLFQNPWSISGGMNNDMYNIFFAEKIIQQFHPELLVVNMQDVDICHTNFTQYCNNLRKADYAVAHLWNTIQQTPGMMNDTILVVAPEHGRNNIPNSILDSNGRYALDHTAPDPNQNGDQMARDIFCLVVGPPAKVNQGLVLTGEGESIEIVPALSNILGYDSDIPGGMLKPYNICDMSHSLI